MPSALRDSLLLICGVLLGIVAGAAIILFLNLEPEQTQAEPSAPSEPAAARQMGASAALPAPAAQAANQVVCPVRPLLAPASDKDGQLLPPAEVTNQKIEEAQRLLQVGKEAESAGLMRDAEVAYLTACRIADARKGSGSAEAGSARAQVARHYATVAARTGSAPANERDALRQRAQAYYTSALESLRNSLGPTHEATRVAAEGLAALQAPQPPPAPAASAAAAASTPSGPVPAVAPAPPVATQPAPPEPPVRVAPAPAQTQPQPQPQPQARAAAEPPRRAPEVRAARQAPPQAEEQTVEVVEPRVRQATGSPGVAPAAGSAE